MIELGVIIALLIFIVFREWRHEVHLRDLEDKVMASNLTEYYQTKKTKNKPRPESNSIVKPDENDIMLGDMAFMDLPKKYNIEVEGSPETPVEQRARKSYGN